MPLVNPCCDDFKLCLEIKARFKVVQDSIGGRLGTCGMILAMVMATKKQPIDQHTDNVITNCQKRSDD